MRILSTVSFLCAIGAFFLPWIDVRCEANKDESYGIVTQSGYEIATGESTEGDAEIEHTANLYYAVQQARDEYKKTGKPKRIFIDFTGVSCTNCKINEKSVFTTFMKFRGRTNCDDMNCARSKPGEWSIPSIQR